MRRMLTSRISRRVLVEHHIALSDSFRHQRQESSVSERPVGIIYTGLNVAQSIQKCATLLKERSRSDTLWPEVIIHGHLDTKFSYIREHLEFVARAIHLQSRTDCHIHRYIVFELIKNVHDNLLFGVPRPDGLAGHVGNSCKVSWFPAATHTGHNCRWRGRRRHPNI